MNKPHKHAEVIKAWADGAKIQYRGPGTTTWKDLDQSTPSFYVGLEFRVKPEAKLIPFIWEDREQLRGKWIRNKNSKREFQILAIWTDAVRIQDLADVVSFSNLFDWYEFIDDSPCGKYVNE